MTTPYKKHKDITTSKPTSSIETITPAIAAEMLKVNRHGDNRRIRVSRVAYYTEMIKRGAWDLNGQSITIAKDGSLLDGQHRLLAVVEADTPIESVVVRDVDPRTFFTIDDGLTRNNGDHMFTNGHKTHSAILAAAAKFCLSFDADGIYKRIAQKVPPAHLIWYVENNPQLLAACRHASAITKLMPVAVGVALYHIFSIVDETSAELFFEALFSGADLKENDPVLTVRNRLLSRRRGDGSNIQSEIIHHLVTAFNAFRAGRKLSRMLYSLDSVTQLEGFKGQLMDSAFIGSA